MRVTRETMAVPLLLSLLLLGVLSQDPPCRFASLYSCQDIMNNVTLRNEFIQAVVHWEGAFHTPGISYNNGTGFTYDGHPLDYSTGEAAGDVHDFSAPSKESIHVGMLALALLGNPIATQWIKNDLRLAVNILTLKMNTYEQFNKNFPGYGGFLPWVTVNDTAIVPTPDWSTPYPRIPALDNGEWVWALYAAQAALANYGEADLAQRYRNLFDMLAKNAKTVFYQGNGKVAAVVRVYDTQAQPSASNYVIDGDGLLDDPYEGELFTVLLDLYGSWDSDADRDQMWVYKRAKLVSVEFKSDQGPITVQEGWWFSAHEQWKLLMLPYLQSPIANSIFANCERARSWNSYMNGIPGLYASVNDVAASPSIEIPDYISAAGIQSIANQTILRTDVVTPYGAFPMMLYASGHAYPPSYVGLCWYRLMLAGPRCQGPYGSTEAVNINGTEISPLVTWDSKITTILALAGGLGDINQYSLSKERDTINPGQTLYQRFLYVINREYGLAFPSITGEQIDFAIPYSNLPLVYMTPFDFSSCQTPVN